MTQVDRDRYAHTYGPGEGDRVQLGDTNLELTVDESLIPVGQECLIGTGKTLREGMHVHPGSHPDGLSTVVLNVILFDPIHGVVRTDIGLDDGRIVGIGNAGNPDVMDVTDGLVIDSMTSIVQAAGLIATPGGVDVHQHFMSPGVISAAIESGVTTVLGMGHGPNPQAKTDPGHLIDAIRSVEHFPVNVGFIGQGSTMDPASVETLIEMGVCGLKIHEDHGAYPAILSNTVEVAAEYGVPLAFHTDSINEAGTLETTLDAFGDRTVHAYHVEGSGGGHIPDLIEIVQEPTVIPSSTNPTIPYTSNTPREQRTLTTLVHHLDESLEEDAVFAQERIQASTMAAEEWLHDMGAISIVTSDSMGMGRSAETIMRTWQLASKMATIRPDALGENERLMRYLAKYTINPAIAHGLDQQVGSIETGKLADIVLWDPAMFGVKPEWIVKSGMLVGGPMGTANGTTFYGEPRMYRENMGATGTAPPHLSLLFVSEAAAERHSNTDLGTERTLAPVADIYDRSKADMVRNAETPSVSVDPDSGKVTIDGKTVDPEPLERAPLTQRYFL